jgi:hypothetical protein
VLARRLPPAGLVVHSPKLRERLLSVFEVNMAEWQTTHGIANDPRYALVCEESLRAITTQESSLDNIRSRAAQLLTAASVATSVLGGLVHARSHHPQPATWAAIATFLVLLAVCVWICSIVGWLACRGGHPPRGLDRLLARRSGGMMAAMASKPVQPPNSSH